MRIDAHHHLWQYNVAEFGWIDEGSVIARSFGAKDVENELSSAGIDASIAVQARQTPEETRFLVEAARSAPIVGVVGWIDLRAERIADLLEEDADPLIVGYRHVVQDEADPAFLLGDAFIQGVRAVTARGLSYDLLINRFQLATVPRFLERAGDGRYILDHAAKPDIAHGAWQPWADDIAAVARYPNVDCKISGLVTEADHGSWTAAEIERYLDHLLEVFGPSRLIWGSDWPVCRLAATYQQLVDLTEAFIATRCPEARDAIFGGNARRAYNLQGLPS